MGVRLRGGGLVAGRGLKSGRDARSHNRHIGGEVSPHSHSERTSAVSQTCHPERASAAERVEGSPDGARIAPTFHGTMSAGAISKPSGDQQLAKLAQNDKVDCHRERGSRTTESNGSPPGRKGAGCERRPAVVGENSIAIPIANTHRARSRIWRRGHRRQNDG